MNAIFAILITLASILLIFVVLIQKSKGGGLAANVSSYNQIGGVRRTTDFVEKATWGLAIFICVLSICSCLLVTDKMVSGKTQNTPTPVESNSGTPVAPGQQSGK